MSTVYTAAVAASATAALVIVAWRHWRHHCDQKRSLVQQVSPRTRVLAVVGDPVNITRTPLVFPAALARAPGDVDAVLVPLHVPASALPLAFAALREWPNLDGFVLTKPHKEAGLSMCDELSPEARVVGAINVARLLDDGRVVGHILDGAGFVDGLAACGHLPRGQRFLLVGAGGAARAIAFTLQVRGAKSIDVVNRTVARAHALVEALAANGGSRGCTPRALPTLPIGPLSDHYDVVVQCTSLGHSPQDAPPLDLARLVPPLVCAEVIHTPLETAFLLAARQRGCTIHHGTHMLDKQIDCICRFLTEVSD